jgi:cell division protein YceG involved in septum cleavage
VDERPRLTVASGEPQPPDRHRRHRRHGKGHAVGVVAGILIGIGVIAGAVVLLTGGDGEGVTGPVSDPAAATTGPPPELKVVFPGGFTRREMSARIGAVNEIAMEERGVTTSLSPKRYLDLTATSELPGSFAGDGEERPLEGFLFPATYTFTPQTTTQELVEMQLDAFDAAWSRVNMSYAEKRNLTPYDVLIIASMIEGEVVVPKERKLVSAVIYNRLKARMPLGIDATLRYGLDIPPEEPITQSQLESDNPYNTRKLAGLPPTPIGNPGLAAMQAAARPAKATYLYFALKKDCKTHFFAENQRQHDNFLNGPNSFLRAPDQCG